MLTQLDCQFCEGSGKCEECNGTGTNPHLDSATPKCAHCSGTGVCPECDGSGRSPLAQPHKGSALKYGILWAAGIIGFFGLMAVVHNLLFTGIAMVAWTVFWYVLSHRDAQRKKPSPRSRF
jgi:hypothetical protein